MNKRDLELLSSYVDGQLSPSDSARLEGRLSTDPDLRTVLDDLRGTRRLLRGLPMRKAPRNFTLTPRMVGKNPPLPRSYPAFRLVSALATLLLFFTFGLNFLAPQMASQVPAYGRGGGGGGDAETFAAGAAPVATEAPATEAPALTEAPVEAPAIEPPQALAPESTLSAEDSARNQVATSEKNGVTEEPEVLSQAPQAPIQNAQPMQRPEPAQPIPALWQMLLAGVAVIGVVVMVLMRQLAASRWRGK